MRRRQRGFSLIEIMVVVLIIAVIAAIAYPSYQRAMERTRRADGREAIMRIAAAQERFFTNRNRYATLADLGLPNTSESNFYRITVALANANQTYTITAAPQGIQAGDACRQLVINNVGNKTAPANTGTNGACW